MTGVVTALDTVTCPSVRTECSNLSETRPANEILFRRRGHVRSEVTSASGQTKICALKYQLEGYIFLVLLLFIKDFKCFLMKEYIHKSTKDILNERPFFKLLYTEYWIVHTIQIYVWSLSSTLHLKSQVSINTFSCFLLCNKSLSQISWNLLKLADDYCLVHAYNPQVKLFA